MSTAHGVKVIKTVLKQVTDVHATELRAVSVEIVQKVK